MTNLVVRGVHHPKPILHFYLFQIPLPLFRIFHNLGKIFPTFSLLFPLNGYISAPYFVEFACLAQWRNHARAITGSARVGFISARAVARPENELGVLCLSITNQDVFCFKTAV